LVVLVVIAMSRSAFAQQTSPGATMFAGAATLYGESPVPLERSTYPNVGTGLHFVIKPAQHMLVNLEYAQGVGANKGVYMKLGYGW